MRGCAPAATPTPMTSGNRENPKLPEKTVVTGKNRGYQEKPRLPVVDGCRVRSRLRFSRLSVVDGCRKKSRLLFVDSNHESRGCHDLSMVSVKVCTSVAQNFLDISFSRISMLLLRFSYQRYFFDLAINAISLIYLSMLIL